MGLLYVGGSGFTWLAEFTWLAMGVSIRFFRGYSWTILEICGHNHGEND